MRERSLGSGGQRFISGNHQYGWLVFGAVTGIFGVIFAVTTFTLPDPPRRIGFAMLFLALAGMSVQFSRASVVVDRAAEVVRLWSADHDQGRRSSAHGAPHERSGRTGPAGCCAIRPDSG